MKLFTREELLPLARSHPEVLVDIILALQERLVQLEQRVKELEDQVARNSSNSGQPPSSDGLSKPSPKSLLKPAVANPAANPVIRAILCNGSKPPITLKFTGWRTVRTAAGAV